MVMDVIAATKLEDLLTPKGRGARVNAHVVSVPREPKPDFDAMKKVIQGREPEPGAHLEPTKRQIPQDD